MFTYNIGDKVLVRSDLVIGETYGWNTPFNEYMNELKGKIVTVKYNGLYECTIEEDNYIWNYEMFFAKSVNRYTVSFIEESGDNNES